MKIKVRCDKCRKEKRRKNIINFKGKFLCSNCKPKINIGITSLEKALNKVYEVRGYLSKSGTIQASINVPSILYGKKVKLILIK